MTMHLFVVALLWSVRLAPVGVVDALQRVDVRRTDEPRERVHDPSADVRLVARQTVSGFGAGQGIAHRDGLPYFYGDVRGESYDLDSPEDDYGYIREYRLTGNGDGPGVEFTGREIRLTKNGVNVAPHPTGLTFHPEFGCFMGDTVNQTGLIFHLDFDRALADGTLDNAILNITADDVAANGARPEFVRFGGRWLVATSDYGDEDNEIRLYDPEVLATSARVSRPGALVASFPATPFVQTLHWVEALDTLVLVQNQLPGRLYRLTLARFQDGALVLDPPIDIEGLDDELEGLFVGPVSGGVAPIVMLSAYSNDNVTFASLRLPGER
ncbi:MAG: hypothetical protein AAF108_10240 [Planctomycetota bacterium]